MEIRAPENTTRCLLWARTWQKQGGFQSLKDMAHGNHWEIRCSNEAGDLSFYRNRKDLEIGENVLLTYSSKDLMYVQGNNVTN